MNAITAFTTKSLKANKVRTLVTIAGVMLAAALLTAVLTTFSSLQDFLYRAEVTLTGSWMAYVESEGTPDQAQDIEAAQADPSVAEWAVLKDEGFAALTEAQQERLGIYLPIRSLSGDGEALCAIVPSEGRMPENDHEILLWSLWQDAAGVEVGDELTLQVGQRQVVSLPEDEDAQSSSSSDGQAAASVEAGSASVGYGLDDSKAFTLHEGDYLDFSMGYLGEPEKSKPLGEALVDTHEQTYTVVGFYNRGGYALVGSMGMTGLVGPSDEPQAPSYSQVFLSFASGSNAQAVKDQATALFPDDNVVLHTAMLRYKGVSDGASIWNTFFGLVVVLAVVIGAACISLIYNAFSISVAERIKQFGLLSSVGASRRQLRWAVVLEGLVVACIGIPLGLLVGLGGCAVTFAFLGPTISEVAGNGAVPFRVSPDGGFLGLAALLTLVTVFVSVWIPAKRASRTNIIESLRTAGNSRVSKQGVRKAEKAASTSKLWRSQGLAGRVFGMGGVLARINRKRGTTKGRAASLSLAIAIVLLMTAGSLNVFLGTLADVAGGGEAAGEVGIVAQFAASGSAEGASSETAVDGQGDFAAATNAPQQAEQNAAAPVTPEALAVRNNALFAQQAQDFQGAYEALSACENAEAKGYYIWKRVPFIIPEAMAGESLMAGDGHDSGLMANGQCGAFGRVMFIDDASFATYAAAQGLNPQDFQDPAHPRAIALAQAYGNDGSVYQLCEMLRSTGTLEVIDDATYEGKEIDSLGVAWEPEKEGEADRFAIVGFDFQAEDDESDVIPLDSLALATTSLEVTALATDPPAVMGGPGEDLTLIVPVSLAASYSFGTHEPAFTSYFDAKDGDHEALCEELASVCAGYFHDESTFELDYYSYVDYADQANSTQMLALVVNVFCLLFTIILALIALANVFNTVTNSLILRRREFAVMKSVGLSNKQFRSLIMDECMSFGITGLVPGLLLSLGVSYLLWMMIAQSLRGLGFMIPWLYVALALVLTVVAMALSVAYGMHRCKADNVVEALRADSV